MIWKYIVFVIFQLQRRMKIAELKQICLRPDVVEVEMDALHFSFTLKNHYKNLTPECLATFSSYGILMC